MVSASIVAGRVGRCATITDVVVGAEGDVADGTTHGERTHPRRELTCAPWWWAAPGSSVRTWSTDSWRRSTASTSSTISRPDRSRTSPTARGFAAGALKFHHLDVRAEGLDELIGRREPEIIVHVAALPPGLGDRVAVECAIVGTLNLLEAACRSGAGKVVVALPAALLYGDVPARELPVKEGRTWEPRSVRGVAARTIADLLAVYRAERGLEFTALALTNVYGSRQRAEDGVVARFAAAAAAGDRAELHGDGRQTRDFVFIDDAVDAFVRAASRGSGLVVNIGTGTQTTIRELHDLVVGGDGPAPRVDGGADR